MNILTRIKNNVEYAYYRELSSKALDQMEKHINDEDATEFKRWAKLYLNCTKKCLDIPLH